MSSGPPLKRFLEKVQPEPNSGCWLWTASVNNQGYGQFKVTVADNGPKLAHRVSYEMFKGRIPAGMDILHSCDMPSCVNPDHLRPGTQSENNQDMISRGRTRYPLGVLHFRAKLSPPEVIAIRSDDRPLRKIAKAYQMGVSTIRQIKHRQIWRHL